MTGFGRGSAANDGWQASVEVQSVNRKQAEVVVQLPRELNELEALVRKSVLGVVSRGRVQVSIHLKCADGAGKVFNVDEELARSFHNAIVALSRVTGGAIPQTVEDYFKQPGIVTLGEAEMDVEQAQRAVMPALDMALASFVAMRKTEGAHLKADLLERLVGLGEMVIKIKTEAPSRPVRQRELLSKRLRDAGLELDLADERVIRELALFADRCDVSEELTRLDSHFAKFREYLDATEPPGRALDFLCQELFREFNTIGSKANDAGIAQTIVEAKTELEKIREQVQNVE